MWYDSWSELPLISSDRDWPRPPSHRISLKDAIPALEQLVPEMNAILLAEGTDVLFWQWNSAGIYTSKSTYSVLVEGGRMEWKFKGVWRCKVPPIVKFFAILFLINKILTREVLQRRGLNCDTKCEMCDTEGMETSVHLLFHYPYAKQVWDTLEIKLGITLAMPKESVQCT